MVDAAAGRLRDTHVGDLRKQRVDDLLRRLERQLATSFVGSTIVRKRRSIGARTRRDTWVRIEARPLDKAADQGQINNGIHASILLSGIAKPRWFQAVEWHDESTEMLWRADECELVTGPDAQPIGYPMTEPELGAGWWSTLNSSLDSLARQHVTRLATPDTEPITQALVTEAIERAFPGQVDTTIVGEPWVPAHADLNWSNLTAPECWILDWEDLGLAPRGLDAATLWMTSIMVPALAEKVYRQRRADLELRSGKLMALFYCAKELNEPQFATTPAYEPTAQQAARLVDDLTC